MSLLISVIISEVNQLYAVKLQPTIGLPVRAAMYWLRSPLEQQNTILQIKLAPPNTSQEINFL